MSRDETIAAELSGDPLTRGYAGMSDDAARDDMNSDYRILETGVFLSDAYQNLSHESNDPGGGNWPVLVMLKELAEDNTIQGTPNTDDIAHNVAINLMGFINKATDAGGQLIFMNFAVGSIAFSWDKMVEVGVMSQAQRDELETLSNIPQSRGSELGVGNVTTGDIIRNRP